MRRFLSIVIAATILTTFAADVSSASGFGPCSQDRFDVKPRMGQGRVAHKVAALIRCAEDRWPVSGGGAKAVSVADCESSLWPWVGDLGGHVGLYQHMTSAWTSRARNMLKHRWFTDHAWDRITASWKGGMVARANVIVSLRMAHSGGWGPWSCA